MQLQLMTLVKSESRLLDCNCVLLEEAHLGSPELRNRHYKYCYNSMIKTTEISQHT